MAVKKILKVEDLNQALVNFIVEITSIGSSAKGNKFDETVKDKLLVHLAGAKLINTEDWCSKSKKSIYYKHKELSSKNNFNFTGLPKIIDNGTELNLMVVDKPNGSQKYPDILVIFNGIGFPIEVKSTNVDNIIWNCGLPKKDSLYIYNCYGKSKTTCFLGQHAINDEEILFLKEQAALAKKLNIWHKNKKWNYYVRNMFNSNQSFFENNNDLNKANEYLLKSNTDLKESHKINHDKLIEKYKTEQENRLFIENETKNKILKLTWNDNQTFEFNDLENIEFK